MIRRLIVRTRAEHDIRFAFDWYESQRAGLGTEFISVLRDHLEAVRDRPESNPVLHRGIRRAVLPQFPYLIFYVLQTGHVIVLAILHHARNPVAWPRRPS